MVFHKRVLVFFLVSLLCLSLVVGLTWVKAGNVYVVTLSSGNKVNVTDVAYSPSQKTLNATIIFERMSAEDIFEVTKELQDIQDGLSKKKQNYSINVIIKK